MHFYRLVRFYTCRRLSSSLSVRVSDSGHPVMFVRKCFGNKPGHKIYCCMSIRSIWNHTLLHNPTILHTKKFFAPACHPLQIYRCMSARFKRHHTLLHNTMILHMKTFFAPACHPQKKISPTSKYDSKTNSSQNISISPSLGLGLGLRPMQPLAQNWYKSLQMTTQVDSYLYF